MKLTDVTPISTQTRYTSNPNDVYGFADEQERQENELRENMLNLLINYLSSNHVRELLAD